MYECLDCGVMLYSSTTYCSECSPKHSETYIINKTKQNETEKYSKVLYEVYDCCVGNMDAMEDSYSKEVLNTIMSVVKPHIDFDFISNEKKKQVEQEAYESGFKDGRMMAPPQPTGPKYVEGYATGLNTLCKE